MGQNQSADFKNEADATNQISQISNEKCIQSQINSSELKTNIVDSTIKGSVNIEQVQLMNGISCVLKSSLDNELVSQLQNFQQADLQDIDKEDPFGEVASQISNFSPYGAAVNALGILAGKNQTINEDNIQRVVNMVTQQMNSMCQNKQANVDAPLITNIQDSKIQGNVNLTQKQQASNTSCTIQNAASNYVKNDISNDQRGSITRLKENGAIAAIIAIVIIIGIVVFVGGFSGKKIQKKPKTNQPSQKNSSSK
jgi:hypothetical protein